MKPADAILTEISRLFREQGSAWYGGEEVTQLEHALQSAMLAEKAGASPALITAALLHDVGHLLSEEIEDCALAGIDDHHEARAAVWLKEFFGPEVWDPIRMHVAAKRYRCGVDPEYQKRLSPASQRSLELQGGPFNESQAQAFREHRFFDEALQLREWDDEAKIAGLETPPLEHFLTYVEKALI